MAATNFTPIILYHTTTASAAPTAGNLNNGELAINITDGKLFYKDNGGTVQVIATKGTGTIGGSNTQVQYNSSGALAGSANFTFNGTTATINTLNLTNALGTAYGGTALTTYTQGDLVYASAANTLAKLGIGANTYILTSTGSVPQWSAPSAVTVATANNLAGGAAGSVPYQSGASTTTFLSIGSAGQVLTSSGSAPQWSNLSSLGVTSLSFGTTGLTPSTATQGAITVAGTLATTNGGTGLTTFTANQVFYASSTSAVAQSANLTFDGTTLTAANFADSSLTSGRVTYAGASGNLTDSGNLIFSGNQLSVQNTAAATGPTNPSYALSATSSNNLILGLTANGEAYTLNTASARYQYYQAGTVISIGTNYVSGSGTAALIDFNAYNSGGSATDLYLGAVSGGTANGAAIFVLGRRTGATSWAESLRIDENGGLSTTPAASGNTVFNENGVDSDFRVESVGNTNMLFVDASASRVGVGVASPAYPLDVNGTANTTQGYVIGGDKYIYQGNQYSGSLAAADIVIAPATSGKFVVWASGTGQVLNANATGELVINEGGFDYDFRVESDTNTHALFVDAGNNQVFIGAAGGISTAPLNVVRSGTANTINKILSLYDSNFFPSGFPTLELAGWQGGGNINRAYMSYEPGSRLVFYTAPNAAGDPTPLERAAFGNSETVFNEQSYDVDFRVESDTNPYMLWVDASADGVNIGGYDTIQGQLNVIKNTGDGVASTTSIYITTGQTYGTAGAIKNLDLVFQGYRDGAGSGNGAKARLRAIEQTGNSRSGRLQITTLDSSGNLQNNIDLTSGEVCINQDSIDMDFRVESDASTHMLFVDAGANAVCVAQNGPSLNSSFSVNGLSNSNNFFTGFVPDSLNNATGALILFDLTAAAAASFGYQWTGTIVTNSYTGNSAWCGTIIAYYSTQAISSYTAWALTGLARVRLDLVTLSYGGVSYLAILKNGGGGTGTLNIDGFHSTNTNIREIQAGSFTVTTTHATLV